MTSRIGRVNSYRHSCKASLISVDYTLYDSYHSGYFVTLIQGFFPFSQIILCLLLVKISPVTQLQSYIDVIEFW